MTLRGNVQDDQLILRCGTCATEYVISLTEPFVPRLREIGSQHQCTSAGAELAQARAG
jgi:hypothetical protein